MMKTDFLVRQLIAITNHLGQYCAAIPTSSEEIRLSAYGNSYQFSDGQGHRE